MANPCLQPQQSDFRGYPFVEFTETKTALFQKNNCTGGQDGSWESYSKTYTSYLSEGDLALQIAEDSSNFNAEGQAHANTEGTCSSGCQTLTSLFTGYDFMAVSSSQIWLNDSTGRPRNALSKSHILAGNDIGSGTLMYNWTGGGRSWRTPYPHTSPDIGYVLYPAWADGGPSNLLRLATRNFATGNACSAATISTALTTKANNDWYVMDSLVLSGGIIILIGYNHRSGVKSCDVHWYSFSSGQSTLINTIHRPHSSVYFAKSAAITYNGSTGYIMVSFASKNNDRRTRTAFYQITFSGGVPTGLVYVIPFDYSNQWLNVKTGCRAGSKMFFLYAEGGSIKIYSIAGGTVSSPSSVLNRFYGNTTYTLWDPFDPQVCYIGTVQLGPGQSYYLVKYTANTDTWQEIRV